MKKFLYGTIIIVIVLILVYVFLPEIYTAQKFKGDHDYVKNTMLQKDSENRGFSDIVKQKVEKEFTNEEERIHLFAAAKSYREVITSENEREFVAATKKMMIDLDCALYVLNKNKQQEKLGSTTKDYLSDSKEMYDYYRYLNRIRFARAATEIMDFNNTEENQIYNEKTYEKSCKK